MKPLVSIREALEDPNLLGTALEGPTWHAWRSLLIAAMGEPLKPGEMEAFTKITGRPLPPPPPPPWPHDCSDPKGGRAVVLRRQTWR